MRGGGEFHKILVKEIDLCDHSDLCETVVQVIVCADILMMTMLLLCTTHLSWALHTCSGIPTLHILPLW